MERRKKTVDCLSRVKNASPFFFLNLSTSNLERSPPRGAPPPSLPLPHSHPLSLHQLDNSKEKGKHANYKKEDEIEKKGTGKTTLALSLSSFSLNSFLSLSSLSLSFSFQVFSLLFLSSFFCSLLGVFRSRRKKRCLFSSLCVAGSPREFLLLLLLAPFLPLSLCKGKSKKGARRGKREEKQAKTKPSRAWRG